MTEWVQNQIDRFRRLQGQMVAGYTATEMALRESSASGAPQFEDPDVPFLQLVVLHLLLADESVVEIATHQDDDAFGLRFRSARRPLVSGADGIYRTRRLEGLPIGQIRDIDTRCSARGNIRAVHLRFANGEIVLAAGEAVEDADGRLRFCLDDESVLLFRRPCDFESVSWYRPSN